MVEWLTVNQLVGGSSPPITDYVKKKKKLLYFFKKVVIIWQLQQNLKMKHYFM